jgi:hypothetical protein
MRMAFVVVTRHEPVVLAAKRLARPASGGGLYPIWGRAGRHREDHGDALRGVRSHLAPRLGSIRQQPIIEQCAECPAIRDSLAILRLCL